MTNLQAHTCLWHAPARVRLATLTSPGARAQVFAESLAKEDRLSSSAMRVAVDAAVVEMDADGSGSVDPEGDALHPHEHTCRRRRRRHPSSKTSTAAATRACQLPTMLDPAEFVEWCLKNPDKLEQVVHRTSKSPTHPHLPTCCVCYRMPCPPRHVRLSLHPLTGPPTRIRWQRTCCRHRPPPPSPSSPRSHPGLSMMPRALRWPGSARRGPHGRRRRRLLGSLRSRPKWRRPSGGARRWPGRRVSCAGVLFGCAHICVADVFRASPRG